MKNKNSFSVNYDKKEITLNFEGEKFKWNLNDGDIGDFWHSFTDKKGIVRDINFHQESETEIPCLSVYGLIYNEKEKSYFINTADEKLIELNEKIGNPINYFGCENSGIEFEIESDAKTCDNCGSTNGYNNSSDEFQCDNCGHSETE